MKVIHSEGKSLNLCSVRFDELSTTDQWTKWGNIFEAEYFERGVFLAGP